MKYIVEWMQIQRYSCPNNSDVHDHLKDFSIKQIAKVNLPCPVSAGEIIVLPDDSEWIVDKVIHKIPEGIGTSVISILRVYPYNHQRVHFCGSNSWVERIPLFKEEN